MSSSANPFRKKAPGTIDVGRSGSPKSSLRSDDPLAAEERKYKPPKKVRVLSPPPLSPDSPEWPFNASQPANDAYGNSYPNHDPFNGASTDESDRDSTVTPPPPKAPQPVGVPANPFNKTLQDIEGSADLHKEQREEGEVLKAANEQRKSFNVDSFKKLLLTGTADGGPADPPLQNQNQERNATSTHAHNVSASNSGNSSDAPSDGDGDDVDDNVDDDVDDDTVPSTAPTPPAGASKDKKAPPPPPSSRHGRALKKREANRPQIEQPDSTEKPLPPAPAGRAWDYEYAFGGDKAPESESQPEAQNSSAGVKKSAPAPPPPRGHSRSESKTIATPSEADSIQQEGSGSTRTSVDEAAPARPGGPAPAPPPPRRPHVAPRQTSQTSGSTTTDAGSNHQDENASSPPPPPPARQPSGRRPTSREYRQRDSIPPPPPPPPRARGGSPKGASAGRTSSELDNAPADPGKGADILADLDALQRELDALRGKGD